MKALQKWNEDLQEWEYVYNTPLGDEEGKKEIAQQRRWAKEDNTGAKYRLVKVNLG